MVRFAKLLTCRILCLLFTYLGIPIVVNPSRVETWKPIIDKCRKKLVPWKHKNLSFLGRICLTSFPIFSLSFFKIPSLVAQKLISIQINFFIGSDKEKRKICWDRVCC